MRSEKHTTAKRSVISLAQSFLLALAALAVLSGAPSAEPTDSSTDAAQSTAPATSEAPAAAQTTRPRFKALGEETDSLLGKSVLPSAGKVIFVLGLVIAGIYGAVALLRRMMGRHAGSGGAGEAIELIESLHLSPKKQISLVRVGHRGALLAVTEQGISSLLELDAAETEAALELARQKRTPVNFKDALGKARGAIVELGGYARKATKSQTAATTATR
ncbi:MAG TPA: flagellar biosynthetic protein FliO [candidate division Zixibacteria bacterium]|nr:flagellar biosynthetic protein FliO [candidate division Zixibacteria bacterium]